MADTHDDKRHTPDTMIPGERDPHNLTHREPGAVSGQFAGADIPATAADWLDRTTAHEHAREGGGIDGEHALTEREKKTHGKK